MKWLFVLLVIGNLAFWGYTRLDIPPAPTDWKAHQINAEKIALAPVLPPPAPAAPNSTGPAKDSAPATDAKDAAKPADKAVEGADARKEAPAEKAAPAQDEKPAKGKDGKDAKPADKPALACFEWRGVLPDDLPNVRKKLTALKLGGDVHVQMPDVDRSKVRYWVYITPRSSQADAQRKADELKTLGVADYFVVNDGSKWQNAISLGLFSSKDAADRRLNDLKEQGVRSAQVSERGESNNGAVVQIRSVPKTAKSNLNAASSAFRGSTVAEVGC
ncbi:MAG: SPOR domain-containing protein [Burkholderiales bacterium]|nr:SPOR domain-containing protein [Burkholderiales bacterium]